MSDFAAGGTAVDTVGMEDMDLLMAEASLQQSDCSDLYYRWVCLYLEQELGFAEAVGVGDTVGMEEMVDNSPVFLIVAEGIEEVVVEELTEGSCCCC